MKGQAEHRAQSPTNAAQDSLGSTNLVSETDTAGTSNELSSPIHTTDCKPTPRHEHYHIFESVSKVVGQPDPGTLSSMSHATGGVMPGQQAAEGVAVKGRRCGSDSAVPEVEQDLADDEEFDSVSEYSYMR